MMKRSIRFVVSFFGTLVTACTASPSSEDNNISQPPRDETPSDAAPPPTPGPAAGSYITGCRSFFAARIVEKQRELDATFPEDCNAALRASVGVQRPALPPQTAVALCRTGESANGCQERVLETPPDLRTELESGCAGGNPGCMLGTWVARCTNGTEAGCAAAEAVCVDGTRPMAYVERATTAASAETPSTKWIIYLGGEGGPCTGDRCWFDYRFGALAGEAPFAWAMSTLHPDRVEKSTELGQGIVSGDRIAANPFAGYNRIRFERCSDAASDAIEPNHIFDGVPASIPVDVALLPPGTKVATRSSEVPVWHKGFSIYKALFHQLATDAGRDLDRDGVADVPSLANATTVVLVASSDASTWLTSAADRLAAELTQIAGAKVDVRIVLDGGFPPALDNEGRYNAKAPAGFNLFTSPYHVTKLCELPDNQDGVVNEACSDTNLKPGPLADGSMSFADALQARGVVRDASCDAMHGSGDSAVPCNDKLHVLLNHVATPFLVLADQEDPVVGSKAPTFAVDRSYRWASPAPFRVRVLDQSQDIEKLWATTAREEGAGGLGNAAVILPKSRRPNQPWRSADHVHLGDDAKTRALMTRCTSALAPIATVSIASMIDTWSSSTQPSPSPLFVSEDASRWDKASPFWVTGGTCRLPE
jgi:hypothetical protein